MVDFKSLFASRTIWSNLIGLAALLLGVLGFDATALGSDSFAEAVVQLVAAGSFIASTVFRILATKRVVL